LLDQTAGKITSTASKTRTTITITNMPWLVITWLRGPLACDTAFSQNSVQEHPG
jgi:hypothetical protein